MNTIVNSNCIKPTSVCGATTHQETWLHHLPTFSHITLRVRHGLFENLWHKCESTSIPLCLSASFHASSLLDIQNGNLPSVSLSHATKSTVFSQSQTHYVFPHANRHYADQGSFQKAEQIRGISSGCKKHLRLFKSNRLKNHSEKKKKNLEL